jgi:hypothetical protein
MTAAFEWVAAEYGWAPRQVRHELTDELLLAYLEAGEERHAALYRRQVEAQRSGYVFAYNHDAYRRWLAGQRVHPGAVAGRDGGGLAGAELERVVMALARTHSDIVAVRRHPAPELVH